MSDRFSYPFGDVEQQDFALGFGELRILQQECDAGPPVILNRLVSNEWTVEDVSSTIRLGLIGVGESQGDAMERVKLYVHDQPGAWTEFALVAAGILARELHGPPGEEQPEK